MKVGDKCPACGYKYTTKKTVREVLHFDDQYKTIPNCTIYYCKCCGNSFYGKETDIKLEKVWKEMRDGNTKKS